MLTRGDLLSLGFTAKGIKHRVASGRLHPLAAGVYAVGRPELSPNGRWMAALLACGDRALDSYIGMPGVRPLRTMLDRRVL